VTGALAVVEIGGTSVKIGFARNGQPLAFNRTHPTASIRTASPVADLAAHLRAASGEASLAVDRIVATVPGFIDRDGDTVLHTANVPELDGLPLASGLSAALGAPVRLERDVVLQLLGEAAAGAVASEQEVLAIYFGTGIGAAYLGAGGIFRGGGWALELGHLPVRPGDPPHRIEEYGSGATLTAFAGAHGMPVADLFGPVSPALATALDDFLWHQALAVASAAALFSPRIILIGGGVPDMDRYPRDTLARRIATCLPDPYRLRPPDLRWARLGWQAAIHGAAHLDREG
jgi:allose kinase